MAQNFYVSLRSIHSDCLSIFDQLGRILHSDNRRQAILTRDHGAVGHRNLLTLWSEEHSVSALR